MGCCAKICVVLLAIVAGLLYTQYRALVAPKSLPELDVNAFWGPGTPPKGYKDDSRIDGFTVKADASRLAQLTDDLKRPLLLPAPLEGVGFEYGVNSVALKEIVRYWRDDYLPRWSARQQILNQFPQFKTQIQG